jgi:hypothetical protein
LTLITTIGDTAAAQIATAEIDATKLIHVHPELHHYTVADGLKGIVESNSFRATYFADMNDAGEIHQLRDRLTMALAARLTPIVERLRKSKPGDQVLGRPGAPLHFARRWAEILYEIIFTKDDRVQKAACCTTSFCSHSGDQPYERANGLLSQWRGYGKDGFCMVLDTTKMYALFELERSKNLYSYTALLQAHYPREEAEMLRCFTELLDLSSSVLETALAGNRDFSVDDLLLPFLQSAIAIKHQGFYEERELRLVAMAVTQPGLDSMARVEGFKELPLKDLTELDRDGRRYRFIHLFGKDFPTIPLRRVIVGPSPRQAENFEFARNIVGSSVPVSKSATPYVG